MTETNDGTRIVTERQPIRVLIVDDHLLMRDGLELLVSTFEDVIVVGTAEDGEQAVALCAQTQPDVVLMDIVMPVMDGPAATAQIRTRYPQIQVIALTSFVEEELIQRSIQAGAIGFLLKNASADQLSQAIRAAAGGQPTLDPAATQVLLRGATASAAPGRDLTERERQVLALLVEGKTNKAIAEELILSPGTVRVYVSNILAKLGVGNRTEAVALAIHHGLVNDQ
jgi:NarL family two-component system response regulator LiaR